MSKTKSTWKHSNWFLYREKIEPEYGMHPKREIVCIVSSYAIISMESSNRVKSPPKKIDFHKKFLKNLHLITSNCLQLSWCVN